MRKFLYLSLMERLKQLTDETGEPVIKTFDLWNEQVSFLEQEEAFETPAVFMERGHAATGRRDTKAAYSHILERKCAGR
jgi:hypothetical protein